ncbi:helix-turn-helix transcriptional regulator [Micromonospora sp. DPT]|uniref:helix-turn-helix domain-containing protein n=1 Tax=Micromonospora sp. DPT TaxID=3142975 RepID=UPI0032089D3E
MGATFGSILQGLMANRHLTRRALSRASGRAESTINQLVAGRIQPTAGPLKDIAPALEMSVADLLVIAGLPSDYESGGRGGSRRLGRLAAW